MKIKILAIGIMMIITISIFAGVSNGNKVETNDTSGWQPINERGFGSKFNRGPRGTAIFNNTFIIGTANYNDNGTLGFNETWPALEYIQTLKGLKGDYNKDFSSNGLEIWSYNGTSWKQLVGNNSEAKNSAGFGNKNCYEVGDLIVFKGYLYAGVRNHHDGSEIWRTSSINNSWECVFNEGGGNKNNVWCMIFEIFKDQLYMGTFNMHDGTEIFRTNDGINWTKVVGNGTKTPAGFGTKAKFYSWSMQSYGSHIYVGAHGGSKGGHLWRSENGVDWEPLIAGKNIFEAWRMGADYPEGFGYLSFGGFRDMEVYNDELYICTAGGWHVNIILSKLGKTVAINNRWIQKNPFLFFKSVAAYIWKYNSTKDKWTRIIGGEQNDISGSGFGDQYNIYFWDMKTDGENLYVSTAHQDPFNAIFTRNGLFNWSIMLETPTGHGEIWQFNGENWKNIVGKGKGLEFDDKYNIGIREMNFYKNSLLIATMNVKTGCEVWELDVSQL